MKGAEPEVHSRSRESVRVAGAKTQDGGRGSGKGPRQGAGDAGWAREITEPRDGTDFEGLETGARRDPLGQLAGSFGQKCGEQGGSGARPETGRPFADDLDRETENTQEEGKRAAVSASQHGGLPESAQNETEERI